MISKKAQQELFQDPNVKAIWTNKDGNLVIGVESLKVPPLKPYESDFSVEEVGSIEALQSRKDKWRPAPGGVSIGHYKITAGTLGGIALKNGRKILSNNHVLADSNRGKIGDVIYQPGPYDIGGGNDNGGGPCPFARAAAAPLNLIARTARSKTRLKPYRPQQDEFLIAHLEEFIPINFTGGYNKVDCALATPISNDIVLDTILDIGKISLFGDVVIGDIVRKSGRTTGLTTETVQAIDAIVRIGYGGGLEAIFENQITTKDMLLGGDSGSWLIHNNTLVGLCFAGSNQISIHNHASDVREALRITL